jgi:hypothetical protein
LIYGIRFLEEDGSDILTVNWVDIGTWTDQEIPKGATIIGCFGKTSGTNTRETTASSQATQQTTEVVGGRDEKFIQSIGFNLWKWA